VLKDMLEVVDYLERAVAMQARRQRLRRRRRVLKGVDLVLRLLKQKLERYEVRPFDAPGSRSIRACTRRSRASSTRRSRPGSVAAELQKGYRVGERLLRPAMVSVSSGGKPTTPPSEG
jgi:molecular chaperone GrpE